MLGGTRSSMVSSSVFILRWTTPYHELDVKSAKWLMKNHHGHSMDSCGVPLETALSGIRCVIPHASRVFVKGVEKVKWIKNLLPEYSVYNIEDKGCPSLPTLREKIGIEKNAPVTAERNVYLLEYWWREYHLRYCPDDTNERKKLC